jgi:S1-C subfamily serine protease
MTRVATSLGLGLLLAIAVAGAVRAEDGSDIYAAVARSTVMIYPASGKGAQRGSGFIVRPGIVATNAHVLAKGDSDAQLVRLVGQERSYRIERVLEIDECHDLALIAVRGLAAPPLPLATVYELKVGQRVYAFGNPGYRKDVFEGTFCDGQVTALRARDGIKPAADILHADIVQANVAVTHGNSGGPLVNAEGEVVGLVSAVVEAQPGVTVAGLAFAVPVKHLLELMPDFKAAHYRFYAKLRIEQARRQGMLAATGRDDSAALRAFARQVFREPHVVRLLAAPQAADDRPELGALVDLAIERYLQEDFLGTHRYEAALAYLDGIAPMAALTAHAKTVRGLRDEVLSRMPATMEAMVAPASVMFP